MSSARPIVVASNRGPVTFTEGGERRGVGGLVTAVGGALGGRDATWIAAARTAEDRERAGERLDLAWGSERLHVRFVDIDAATFAAYYDGFSNRVIWFVNHYLWDAATAPDFEVEHGAHWVAFGAAAERFADAIADESVEGSLALPQDYHLALVPALLRERLPDLPVGMFWHTPFCQPDQFGLLPDAWASALLEGMLGADLIGFHASRWADNFMACCATVLGTSARGHTLHHRGHTTRVGVYPLGVDVEGLAAQAAKPGVEEQLAMLNAQVGDRVMLLRVDRTEMTKNILRGLLAYEHLLEARADLREQVVHMVMLSPSRSGIAEYEAYIQDCRARAATINDRFGTDGWTPVLFEVRNEFERTLAAYRRYDVLLVNPVYDGMNLIAREGPLLNERNGVLVLSRNAGAAAELGDAAIMVNPFDIEGTARALAQALDMDRGARETHAAAVRAAAAGTPPARWLQAQIRDLERAAQARR